MCRACGSVICSMLWAVESQLWVWDDRTCWAGGMEEERYGSVKGASMNRERQKLAITLLRIKGEGLDRNRARTAGNELTFSNSSWIFFHLPSKSMLLAAFLCLKPSPLLSSFVSSFVASTTSSTLSSPIAAVTVCDARGRDDLAQLQSRLCQRYGAPMSSPKLSLRPASSLA